MPRTILGKVSLAPRGEYSPEAAYTALDVVSYRGSSWLALKNVTGVMPEEGESWMLLAQKGDQGEQGIQGIQGIQGETGGPGPTGPQGASFTRLEKTAGTGAPGTIDMYTAYNSDDEEAGTIKVYNGMDGIGAGDFKADGTVPMTGNLQMAQHKVTGLADATDDGDAVNKGQMDEALKNVKVDTDATPTEKSTNPVQSGGVYTALAGKADLTLSNLSNKQKALRNIGGRPNRNLLDNWDFTGRVVNQRGKNIYTVQALESANSSYTVDRMIVSASANASATLTVSDGSLVLACSPPGGGGLQVNLFERLDVSKWPRGTYTLAWLYESDVIVRPFVYTDESGVKPGYSDFPTTSGKPNIANIEFDLTEADRTVAVNLQINSGAATSTKIYACKVEYGTGQTLAAQVDDKWMLLEHADYSGELAKCQRYYCKSAINLNETQGGEIAFAQNAEWLNTAVKFPVEMRITPTVSIRRIAFCSDIGQNLLIEGASAEVMGIDQTGFNTVKISGISTQTDARYNIQYEASAEL